jgi:hypothetical protein
VLDRIGRIEAQSAALHVSTGNVADNLTGALTALFESVAVAIVGLIVSRDNLRTRLRRDGLTGVPLLTEATAMIASYLTIECERGHIAADADIDTLALTLIGAGHLLFTGREGSPPAPDAVHKVVATVMADVLQRRLL